MGVMRSDTTMAVINKSEQINMRESNKGNKAHPVKKRGKGGSSRPEDTPKMTRGIPKVGSSYRR